MPSHSHHHPSLQTMAKPALILFTLSCFLAFFQFAVEASNGNASAAGLFVQKHERKPLIQTEYGEISAVNVYDGTNGPYRLQFITMEPNSLFLPVLLHADMVLYVETGSGTLSWTDDEDIRNVNIRRGDIYRLHPGSVFFVHSSLESERAKLRITAIFSNTEEGTYEPTIGEYSSINDVLLGFDPKILQAAFKVPEDVIAELMEATKPAGIIHAVSKKEDLYQWQARVLKVFLGSNKGGVDSINGKKKKIKAYNVLEADPDFKNCNGWSVTVYRHELQLLRGSNIGVFMVNLTKGSMMGPHWNPTASEIAIVLQGQGMIRVVCPSNAEESECKNLRFRVREGDVFAVPRFHPMAQMSFNNDSFVFMGFSTSTMRNYPQFLAGKKSVLQVLNGHILAESLNVSKTTIHQLLTQQKESVILDCTSCAEGEETIMEEEIERERREEEERRKKEEEEERKKEEEERRKEEEEAARKREEEAKKREEEEEEARKREEEEARKRKEEEEEEEAKRREEEEEEARRQEEERQRRAREEEEEEEEEERKRQEEKEQRKEEKEQEKERQREEEEEEAAEEARRWEKERQRRAEEEEEEEEARREKQRGQPEEGGDEGEEDVPRRVWLI